MAACARRVCLRVSAMSSTIRRRLLAQALALPAALGFGTSSI